MRRSVTTLFLLAALLFNSAGYLGLFFAAHVRARGRMSARQHARRLEASPTEAEALVEIEVSLDHPPKDFARVGADEVWYRGAMYDVVRVERQARTRRFYVFADAYDTASVQRLAQTVTRRPSDAKAPPILFSFLKSVYAARPHARLRAPLLTGLLGRRPPEEAPPAPFVAVAHPPPWLG